MIDKKSVVLREWHKNLLIQNTTWHQNQERSHNYHQAFLITQDEGKNSYYLKIITV